MQQEIASLFSFIKLSESLKDTCRSASHTSLGKRESVAEHSWRVALLALLMLRHYPELDAERVLGICLIHDLAESITGDISAADNPDPQMKSASESAAIQQLASVLCPVDADLVLSLFAEYHAACSPEARFAKAVDKAETIIQHNQGKNPDTFDYAFNLDYGAEYFEGEALKSLRSLIDRETGGNIKL